MSVAIELTTERRSGWVDTVLLGGLLLFGLYFPTSTGGEFSKFLLGVNYLAVFLLLMLLARRHGIAGFWECAVCLSIVPVLLLFTITSPLNFYSPGALVEYAVLSLLLILNLRNLVLPESLFKLFFLVNMVTIGAAVAILLGFDLVTQFFVAHYSMFLPDLVQYMLEVRKPVLTFGTHSLAGLFLYLFFFASLQTWRLRQKKEFLAFACCYVVLIVSLLSVTGLLLGAVALLQLSFYVWQRNRRLVIGAILLVAAGLPAVLHLVLPEAITWHDLFAGSTQILNSSENGLSGRFGPGGTLYYDVQYLYEHPFSPIGISYSDKLFFGDSGPVEYFLRGSIILLVVIYGGFLAFLRRNLVDRSEAHLLCAIVILFEFGLTSLTNFRTLYLIPFFVAYLNGLRLRQAAGERMPVENALQVLGSEIDYRYRT